MSTFAKALIDLRQALGERNAPAANADQSEVLRATALLDDFVRQTLEGAVDFFGGEELSFFHDAHFGASS